MSQQSRTRRAPLVAHIVHRLDTGGMENGLVNLINAPSADRFRHAVICLTDFSHFAERLQRKSEAVRVRTRDEALVEHV